MAVSRAPTLVEQQHGEVGVTGGVREGWGGECVLRPLRFLEGEDRAKAEVLDDGQLAKHLSVVHLEHPGVHLLPVRDTADVVQHWRVLTELPSLDLVDEAYAAEVEVVVGVLVHKVGAVDRPRLDQRVVDELSGAPEKRQKVVIVEAPHAMGARGFEEIRHLQPPHQLQVLDKNVKDKAWKVALIKHTKLSKTTQPRSEVGLVAAPIVDPGHISKRVREIWCELNGGRGQLFRKNLKHKLSRTFDDAGQPLSKGLVPVTHWLLKRRRLIDPDLKPFQQITDFYNRL
eukprot:CAMPEP_0196665302 /NCGR_PEP_ID=MMETSP1086-20130531/60396_1 /TAXON_ID=77921 /ORGANISM="Cyanoptyche  gloeocystis , Strain SAG4.97" /LENGTH=285 /DNA_ID=CAMNT_0042001971 /DNA_START=708 /DNA_END=1566 /DNA_ORIENTATION=-